MIDEKTQRLIIHRSSLALLGSLLHTAICIVLFIQDYFRTSLREFVVIFCAYWCINFSFYGFILWGFNKRFKDPGLTLPLMVWAVFSILVTVFLTDYNRAPLLMMILLIMMFGAFRLNLMQYLYLTTSTIISYFFVIILLFNIHPRVIILKEELLQSTVFVILLFFISDLSLDLRRIRKKLKGRTKKLEKAMKKIQISSQTDELTHIKNRRYLLDILNNQRLIAERKNDYTFSVCLLDIDHYKTINDEYGHGAGDIVLKAFSKEIMKRTRVIDVFGRLGGDEFLLISPEISKEGHGILCERLRNAIENLTLHYDGQLINVTVSIGAIQYRWPESIEQMMVRLDKALYKAKSQGRNRTILD